MIPSCTSSLSTGSNRSKLPTLPGRPTKSCSCATAAAASTRPHTNPTAPTIPIRFRRMPATAPVPYYLALCAGRSVQPADNHSPENQQRRHHPQALPVAESSRSGSARPVPQTPDSEVGLRGWLAHAGSWSKGFKRGFRLSRSFRSQGWRSIRWGSCRRRPAC